MSIGWESLTFTGSTSLLSKLRGSRFLSLQHETGRKILHNLSGTIRRGELTALMGPSGAGKSTLLNCLIHGANYEGFDEDGRIFDQSFDEDGGLRACLITQDEKEHLLLNLTVKESLIYAARMKNSWRRREGRGRSVNCEDIVRKLLLDLKLEDAKDNPVIKCSGGQKKRLAIGLELTREPKPNLIFLDEPTSGLDSFVGEQVIRLLRVFAQEENMAIVSTIHQPSFRVFSMFHNVYILSRAGRFIFAGSPTTLKPYIAKFLDGDTWPEDVNPADLIIEIASSAAGSNGSDEHALLNEYRKMCAAMSTNYLKQVHEAKEQIQPHERKNWEQKQENGLCSNRCGFGVRNLFYLTQRTLVGSILRQKGLLCIRFLLHTVVALALILLYKRDIGLDDGCSPAELSSSFDTSAADPNPVMDPWNCSCVASAGNAGGNFGAAGAGQSPTTTNNVKFQFFSLLFLMFASLMPTVLTFPAEIKIFLNEHRNGWYTTSTYYISKSIVEFLIQIWYPFLYVWFLYWFTQQIGMEYWYSGMVGVMSHRYTQFLSITMLSCFIAQGLGFLIGILCVNSFNSTIIVSSSTLLYLFLFSGFFVKRIHLPNSSQWLTALSFIRFSFESLLIIIYGQERCGEGDDGEGNLVLSAFDLHDSDLVTNIVWLFGHLITIRAAALIALMTRAEPKLVKGWFGLKWAWTTVRPFCNRFNPACYFGRVPCFNVEGTSAHREMSDTSELNGELLHDAE